MEKITERYLNVSVLRLKLMELRHENGIRTSAEVSSMGDLKWSPQTYFRFPPLALALRLRLVNHSQFSETSQLD